LTTKARRHLAGVSDPERWSSAREVPRERAARSRDGCPRDARRDIETQQPNQPGGDTSQGRAIGDVHEHQDGGGDRHRQRRGKPTALREDARQTVRVAGREQTL
jgi:hypothetical protein